MNRRKTPLWNRHSEAITPEPRQPYDRLTHEELVAELLNVKRLLSAERRTNQKVQRAMMEFLDEQETKANNARAAFFEAQTLRPSKERTEGKLMATIATGAALDRGLRKGFSDAGIRIAPDTTMTAVLEAFKALGITVELQDDILVIAQGGTEFNSARALRGFAAKPEHAKFFILQTGDPRSWTTEQKVEYLKTHNDSDYRRLIQSEPITVGVGALDANMSKADYLRLTRREKLDFISEFGTLAVSRVMARAK